MTMLCRLASISKCYGAREVLRVPALEIRRGETLALVGPSGAGKSTLLRVASGVLRPQSGRLLLAGRDAATWSPREIARTVATLPISPGSTPAAPHSRW